MDDPPTPTPPEPASRLDADMSYSLVGRVQTARGLYYWLAFVTGAFGVLMLSYPVSINAMIPGLELSRWWGLLGLFAAVGLFETGRRLTQLELPEDFSERRREAIEEESWPRVYEWTRLKADVCRQRGDIDGELEARERMVELTLERLDHGQFQALGQLRRIERVSSNPAEVTARIADLLRDLEGLESLVEVLERRLEQIDGDPELEYDLRRELVDLYGELDHLDREERRGALVHVEWLLEHEPSPELVEDVVDWARETGFAADVADMLESTDHAEAGDDLDDTDTPLT